MENLISDYPHNKASNLKFLEHRIADKRILRMVKRFLKAGVYEDGSITIPDEGTPQGGLSEASDKPPYLK